MVGGYRGVRLILLLFLVVLWPTGPITLNELEHVEGALLEVEPLLWRAKKRRERNPTAQLFKSLQRTLRVAQPVVQALALLNDELSRR